MGQHSPPSPKESVLVRALTGPLSIEEFAGVMPFLIDLSPVPEVRVVALGPDKVPLTPKEEP